MTKEDLMQTSAGIWLQICPKCRQLWVIGAAREDEAYRCKACGTDFSIGYENLPVQAGPEPKIGLHRH